jgi:hypothetical protein
MAGEDEESDLFGVRFKGERLSDFREFKEEKGATSGSDALRRAVDLAIEVENEGRPRELRREIDQLQTRLKEKDSRIDELRGRIEELEEENRRLGKTPPLEFLIRLALWGFAIGVLFFVALSTQMNIADPNPILELLAQVSLTLSVVSLVSFIPLLVGELLKIFAPNIYQSVAREALTLPFVDRVFAVDLWLPEEPTGKEED